MNKKILLLGIFIFVIFSLTKTAFAFGIVSPYFEGRDFVIAPGQIKTAELILQNMVGDEDIRIRVIMIKNESIATVSEQTYLVRANTSDTTVPITIRIPEDAPIGTTYGVVVGFETVSEGGGGAVSLGTGIETKIPVRVVSKESSPDAELEEISYTNLVWAVIIIVLILLIILIIWLIKRRQNNAS